MPFSEKTNSGLHSRPIHSFAQLAILGLVLWAGIPFSALANSFDIRHARTTLKEGIHYVDAVIDIEFSKRTTEALNSGLAIPIRIDIKVVDIRQWWLSKTITRLFADYELQHHALSKQYLVKNTNLNITRGYNTLQAAQRALGALEDFPLIDGHLLSEGKSYSMAIRARLHIEALPVLLRPRAYIGSLWDDRNPWYQWPLQR